VLARHSLAHPLERVALSPSLLASFLSYEGSGAAIKRVAYLLAQIPKAFVLVGEAQKPVRDFVSVGRRLQIGDYPEDAGLL
jgi:hypothetical protein